MRIIGGKLKGRKLNAPKNLPARPTKDITKESLFNILHNRYFFDEIRALDLFSGTGNIAFEFASRGTPSVLAVDRHPGSIRFIKETARKWDLPVSPIRSDVLQFLSYPPVEPFDVIFADPPYDMPAEELRKIIELIMENGFLSPEGILILEHHKKIRLDDLPFFRQAKTYGHSVLSFFENTDNAD